MATLKRNLCRMAFHVFVPSINLTGSFRGSSGVPIPAFYSSRLHSMPCFSDNSRILVTGLAAVPNVEKPLSPLVSDSYSRDSFSSDTQNRTISHSNLHRFGSHGLLDLQKCPQSPLTKCSSPSFPSSCGRKISVSSLSTYQHKYNTNTTGSGQKSSICTSTRLLKEGPASSSGSSSSSENFDKQQEKTEQRTVAETVAETESVKLGDRQKEEDVPSRLQSNSESSHGGPTKVEIVKSHNLGTFLGRPLFNLWSSLKMAGYLQFHKLLLEESFDENDFLEGAKHAFTVVQELLWIGDFETMSTMVTPRVAGAFKKAYNEMLETNKKKGLRVEFTVTKVESASLVDFEFSFEDDGKGRYGLQNFVPQIDDYHDDTFLVLSVQLYAELSVRNYTDQGKLEIVSVSKGFHTIKLGRQIPKILGLFTPVKEFKSPWFFVDMR